MPRDWAPLEWNVQGTSGGAGPADGALSVIAQIIAIVAAIGAGEAFVRVRREQWGMSKPGRLRLDDF